MPHNDIWGNDCSAVCDRRCSKIKHNVRLIHYSSVYIQYRWITVPSVLHAGRPYCSPADVICFLSLDLSVFDICTENKTLFSAPISISDTAFGINTDWAFILHDSNTVYQHKTQHMRGKNDLFISYDVSLAISHQHISAWQQMWLYTTF